MNRTDYRYNLEYRAKVRTRILVLTKDLVAGKLGVIAAARELGTFHDEVEPEVGEILAVFVGIDSETDALPIGDVRSLWDPEVLKLKDPEIAAAELKHHDWAFDAAGRLILILETNPS
jgi:hypothetical protein